MAVECVWFDEIPDRPWNPGDCFPLGYELSKHYLEHVATLRKAISVCIPTPEGRCTPFCIDAHPTNDPNGGWQVTIAGDLIDGQKPDITVTPSLHAVGIWHGWLTNGVLIGA